MIDLRAEKILAAAQEVPPPPVRVEAEDVVREAINSFLEHERKFVEAVEKGLASLDRGEYITNEEVTSRIDKLLRP